MKKKKEFEKLSKKVFILSLFDDNLVSDFKRELTKILSKV